MSYEYNEERVARLESIVKKLATLQRESIDYNRKNFVFLAEQSIDTRALIVGSFKFLVEQSPVLQEPLRSAFLKIITDAEKKIADQKSLLAELKKDEPLFPDDLSGLLGLPPLD